MRNFRSNILNLYSFLGFVAVFATLIAVTAFLTGAITPEKISLMLEQSTANIQQSTMSWWMGIFAGWFAAAWTTMYLIRTQTHPPIQVKQDESGAVEVTTGALCTLARTEARAHGIQGPCVAEFTRKLGSPILQIWCDLTSGPTDDDIVIRGDSIRSDVEKRLLRDFNVEGIRVAVIHKPRGGKAGKTQALKAT